MEIGPWRIVRTLSSSGLCVVYEVVRGAERAALKRYVGLHLLDEETRRRFSREIRLGLAVQHPHVCRTLDWGMGDDGAPYLVMELLEGETLRRRLDQTGTPEPAEARRLVEQVLQGVEAIHRSGLVHRDLQPQNIFLTRDADVRILDFGLTAKFGGGSLTPSGISLGTVPYTAPEQVFNARHVDARADLFSVGVLYFEMLTGEVPFGGRSLAETLSLLTSEAPPRLSTFRPELADSPTEAFVHRLMARLAQDRPATAAEALAQLP